MALHTNPNLGRLTLELEKGGKCPSLCVLAILCLNDGHESRQLVEVRVAAIERQVMTPSRMMMLLSSARLLVGFMDGLTFGEGFLQGFAHGAGEAACGGVNHGVALVAPIFEQGADLGGGFLQAVAGHVAQFTDERRGGNHGAIVMASGEDSSL